MSVTEPARLVAVVRVSAVSVRAAVWRQAEFRPLNPAVVSCLVVLQHPLAS